MIRCETVVSANQLADCVGSIFHLLCFLFVSCQLQGLFSGYGVSNDETMRLCNRLTYSMMVLSPCFTYLHFSLRILRTCCLDRMTTSMVVISLRTEWPFDATSVLFPV